MKKFKAGDVVQLPSGGPAMTVLGDSKDHPGQVVCAWFLDDGSCQLQHFPADALRTASSHAEPPQSLPPK
jgi:uncharacterized protein YodC (DUF2158 family)